MQKQQRAGLLRRPLSILLRPFLALAFAAGLASMPALPAQADPGEGGSVVSLPAGPQTLTASISPEAQQGLNTILQAVPGDQRPLLINAFGALGPVGAEATLRIYASLPPEMVEREFSYVSGLIQNWPPNYQQAILIDYLLNRDLLFP